MSQVKIQFESELDFNKLILEKIMFMNSVDAENELRKLFPTEEVNVFVDRGGNMRISVGNVNLVVKS